MQEGQTFLFNLDAQLLFNTLLLAMAILVLFLVMSHLLFNPARKFLKDRQDRIVKEIEAVKADRKRAAALTEEYDSKLKIIEKEAEFILSEARQKALKQEAQIKLEAKTEATTIIKRAQKEAELEKKHAMDDVKQEIVAIASFMAAKVVTANMNSDIQDALVEETLKEMGESTWLS